MPVELVIPIHQHLQTICICVSLCVHVSCFGLDSRYVQSASQHAKVCVGAYREVTVDMSEATFLIES